MRGVGFWEGVRGIKELREKGAERQPPEMALPRAYTLALPFALCAYLRAVGDPGGEGASYAEKQRAAVGAAVLAGAVCAAVGVFCAGVVRDWWVEPFILPLFTFYSFIPLFTFIRSFVFVLKESIRSFIPTFLYSSFIPLAQKKKMLTR
ncbi:hypothetical protein B0H12DRAFT_1098879 [Mycena haematopus]|nr:hypothetical protein B0H12DRAFT_1098879 [Mycena haematopus]